MTESKLGVMKDMSRFYQVDTLKVIVIENLGLQILDRVILWLFQKEEKIAQDKIMVGKCR